MTARSISDPARPSTTQHVETRSGNTPEATANGPAGAPAPAEAIVGDTKPIPESWAGLVATYLPSVASYLKHRTSTLSPKQKVVCGVALAAVLVAGVATNTAYALSRTANPKTPESRKEIHSGGDTFEAEGNSGDVKQFKAGDGGRIEVAPAVHQKSETNPPGEKRSQSLRNKEPQAAAEGRPEKGSKPDMPKAAGDSAAAVNTSGKVTQIKQGDQGVIIIAERYYQTEQAIQQQESRSPPEFFVRPMELPQEDISNYERLLKERRAKLTLSPAERWECAVAATRLARAGRTVPDMERWVNEEAVGSIRNDIGLDLGLMEPIRVRAKEKSIVLLAIADLAFRDRKFDAAISCYKSYIELAEKITLAKNPDEALLLTSARKKLGISYLDQAEIVLKRGDKKLAYEYRALALAIYNDLSDAINGHSLDILPNKEGKPEGWLFHLKTGDKWSADVRHEGTKYFLHLANTASSYFYAKLVQLENPKDYELKWQWRLDQAPDGARDPGSNCSVNHPLTVVVAFLRNGNEIVAIHYVWDPLEPVGKTWVDPDSDPVEIRKIKYKTTYLHVAVASADSEQKKWLDCKVDPAADYKRYFNEEAPPVQAVLMATNSQFGVGEARMSSEGCIGGLEFVKRETATPPTAGSAKK